jgi:hypothetical protein
MGSLMPRAAVALALAFAASSPSNGLEFAQRVRESPINADLRPLAVTAPATTPGVDERPSDGTLSDRVVSYVIRATLDPSPTAKTITGSARIQWRNRTDAPVPDLYFHLYLNAFRDDKSTFMRGSSGSLRDDLMPKGQYGRIDVTSLRLVDGEDLIERLEFVQPDDGNVDDRTVARVVLPKPVGPRQTVAVDVEFVSKLPGVFARTGYKDNFFLVGQWFPKLGVYELAGMRGRAEAGWNCHQFHPNSEFYADFGSYEVEITTPTEFVVGATGELVTEAPNGDGTTTRHYRQHDVHDFAWTADDDYIVGRRVYAEPGFPEVQVTALVQPRHASTVDRHLDACIASLSWFNHNVGTYPYATLTVVDPELGAGGASGMEYPTFITAGIEEVISGSSPRLDDPLLELVIFHEFGHQYWYGMVATNEFEEPWLDEGINSYSESLGLDDIWPHKRALRLVYGDVAVVKLPFDVPLVGASTRFAALPQIVRRGPLINTSWGFGGDYNYGINSYYRPAVALRTLRGLLGDETMARVMRVYFERWKFRHPNSQDFFDVASEVSQQDLAWFFDQFFKSDRVLDYAVQGVERKREATTESEGRESTTNVTTEIVLERQGDGIFPVTARVTYEDGTSTFHSWDGRSAQTSFTVESSTRVTRVEIDPGHVVMLDANFTNNSFVVDTDDRGPLRIATEYGLFFQHALLVLAGAV